jgi:hypothetical protein
MALDKLGLAIGKFQYQDFLLFLEAQERFALSARYWKHRPNINVYRDHYKEWFVLKEPIKGAKPFFTGGILPTIAFCTSK